MLDLKNFFKNQFETLKVGDAKLQKFCEVHIQLLTANNPGGIYDQNIIDITNCYTKYFGAMGDKSTQVALREAKTVAMSDSFDSFKKFVSRQEGLIRSKWGVDAPVYQEFYPQGITEYSNSTLANVEVLMTRFKNATATHAADLGAAFVTELNNIITAFTNARTTQLQLKAIVENKRTETSGSRNDVEIQLMKNLLLIASNNVGDVSVLEDYFDQSFIRPEKKDIHSGKLPAGSTKNIVTRTFDPTQDIRIKNLSGAMLVFGLGFSAEAVITEGVKVAVGEEIFTNAGMLGNLENKYLNVTNSSPTHPGEYEVEFL